MKIIACKHLLNHDLYPIDEPRNPLRASVVQATRAALAEDGCAVIRNIFSKQGLAALLAEGVDRKAKAYYSENKACNVYLGDGNPAVISSMSRTSAIRATNAMEKSRKSLTANEVG